MEFPDTFWSINPVCRLHWRCWGESYILFNETSCQTHYLNHIAVEILQLLAQAILTEEQLSHKIAEKHGFQLDDEMRNYIAETMISMDELGLIEPHSDETI